MNSYCIWKIPATAGNRISLEIKNIDIAVSPNCNENYLEIRKEEENGELIGVYCGNEIPENFPSASGFWIKYKTDGETPNNGFLAEYKYSDFSELSGSSGVIENPIYPNFIRNIYFSKYRISVKQGSLIRLEFEDFYMNMDEDDEECWTYVRIFNGFDETAPIIDEFCNEQPERITSETNVLFIKFSNTMSFKSKFKLTWNEVERNLTDSNSNEKCGNELISLSSEQELVNFTSPGYPFGYEGNLDCTWKIVSTIPSYHPVIFFKNIDLEVMDGCLADYVSVSRSRDDGSWAEIQKLCAIDIRDNRYFDGTPDLQVKFHSDYNTNETGFNAELMLECGGHLTEPEGIIEYNITNVKKMSFFCMWNVTVRRGRKIQFEFLELNLKNRSNVCSSYVVIKNGYDDGSPYLGDGQYCGAANVVIPLTSSNRAFVKHKLNSGFSSDSFKLRYYEVQHECGGEVRLNLENPSKIITSPNYPNIPHPHIECVWTIIGPIGENLRIEFLDRFDLAGLLCTKEYLELREGSTAASGLIGKYCGYKLPPTKFTRSNVLRMKYFTDTTEPNNGFKVNISIGDCGGTFRPLRGDFGYISSPKYPGLGSYPANTTCDYRIIGPPNFIFTIKILDIGLAENTRESESDESLMENCNEEMDHLVIYSVMPNNTYPNGETLIEEAKLCANEPPKKAIVAASSEVLIRLKSFPRTQNLYKGFKLSYNSSRLRCGEIINADSGIITSIGYPNAKLNPGTCKWQITARKGRKIKFEILDLDLASDQKGQKLMLFNDYGFETIITTLMNSSETSTPVYTTDNKAMIVLFVRLASNNRGFKLRFSSDEPKLCTGDLNEAEGFIYQPAATNLTSISCTYTRESLSIIPSSPPNTGTIALYFSNLNLGSSSEFCSDRSFGISFIQVRTDLLPDDPLLIDFCGNATKSFTLRSPWRDTKIITKQAFKPITFTIQYKTHNCGGILKGSSVIRNIQPQRADYKILDCAWLIKYDQGVSAEITINSLNLKLPCDNEYINIYNGPKPTSPLLMKLCGNDFNREALISQHGTLFIEYHTDNFKEVSKDSTFEIKTEPNIFACGGVLHKLANTFKSPLYNKPYPPNTECVWILTADSGYHVGVSFQGRFFIEQSDNCTKDYLEFYDYVDDDWKFLRRVCGRETPKPVNSTSSKMKVIFRSDDNGAADGFNATWQQNCGGVILVDDKKRVLSSPGYPIKYAGSLKCNYTFRAANEEAYVNIKFLDFELEGGSGKCIYDILTIYKKLEYAVENIRYAKVGSYCGNKIPEPARYKHETILEFKSDPFDHMKGFQVEYNIDNCGGWVKNSSVISSPEIVKRANTYDFMGTLTCTWNITAPRDKKIVIKFEKFNFQYSEYCSFDYVQIFNGSVEEDKFSLARLCHNLTIPPIVINNNEAIIKMRTDQSFNYIGFSAIISFKQKCDEHITLTKQNPTYIIDKTQETQQNNLECTYKINSDPMSVIKLTFDEMHLSICDPDQRPNRTCDCDYLEIYDGNGPFSQVIGRYCGHSGDREIVSTGSALYIRFVTDNFRSSNGFKLTLRQQESPCGDQNYFNFTENSKQVFTITSPKLPGQASYMNNIRCMWMFEASYRDTLEIIFNNFDIEDSENCQNDYLKIEDDAVKSYIMEGLGEQVIYRGHDTYKKTPVFYLGVNNPIGAHIYCGSSQPHEYFSQSSKLRIYFVTNSASDTKEKEYGGFNFTVKTISACSRNFTALQGRYYSGSKPESCKTTITVPANYTISLYFYRFFYILNDCEKSFMKIYDGDFDNGALLATYCGYTLPNPIFSTGNQISIVTKNDNSSNFNQGTFDIFYIASEKSKGPGCGGDIYNYGGFFTSPLYPNNNRTNFDCTWNIMVPQNLKVAVKFAGELKDRVKSIRNFVLKHFHKTLLFLSLFWKSFRYGHKIDM